MRTGARPGLRRADDEDHGDDRHGEPGDDAARQVVAQVHVEGERAAGEGEREQHRGERGVERRRDREREHREQVRGAALGEHVPQLGNDRQAEHRRDAEQEAPRPARPPRRPARAAAPEVRLHVPAARGGRHPDHEQRARGHRDREQGVARHPVGVPPVPRPQREQHGDPRHRPGPGDDQGDGPRHGGEPVRRRGPRGGGRPGLLRRRLHRIRSRRPHRPLHRSRRGRPAERARGRGGAAAAPPGPQSGHGAHAGQHPQPEESAVALHPHLRRPILPGGRRRRIPVASARPGAPVRAGRRAAASASGSPSASRARPDRRDRARAAAERPGRHVPALVGGPGRAVPAGPYPRARAPPVPSRLAGEPLENRSRGPPDDAEGLADPPPGDAAAARPPHPRAGSAQAGGDPPRRGDRDDPPRPDATNDANFAGRDVFVTSRQACL